MFIKKNYFVIQQTKCFHLYATLFHDLPFLIHKGNKGKSNKLQKQKLFEEIILMALY